MNPTHCCKCRLWFYIVSVSILIMVVSILSLFFLSKNVIDKRDTFFSIEFSNALIESMLTDVENLIGHLQETALGLFSIDPLLHTCDIPSSNYDPQYLARYFDVSRDHLATIGFFRKMDSTENGKLVWQTGRDIWFLGCDSFFYGYSDPSIYPAFRAYCISEHNYTTDYSDLRYEGIDWGLDEESNQWFKEPYHHQISYSPVTVLLGQLMVTIKVPVTCDQENVYAITFAETSLSLLDIELQRLVREDSIFSCSKESEKNIQETYCNRDHLLMIIEKDTRTLIASSIENQTIQFNEENPTTVTIDQVEDERLQWIGQHLDYSIESNHYRIEDWIVFQKDIDLEGIDWMLIVATSDSDIDLYSNKDIRTMIIILIVLIVLIIIHTVLIVTQVSLPLYNLRKNEGSTHSFFHEIDYINDYE